MAENILEVKHLKKYFKTARGTLHAVDDVSFTIEKGKTLGIVGESGCGKSTTGRAILRLLEPTDGQVIFNGQDITALSSSKMRQMRRDMQIIFQDPFSSLDPKKTVSQTIAEPIIENKILKDKKAIDARVRELMATVGLAERLVNAYPHELDGGRRQRIGIALDVSIQAQILNLLQELKEQMGLTFIFITHDLSVVNHFADEIAVMYLGQLIEKAPTEELFDHPVHPYTRALLSAIPIPEVGIERPERILLRGEISSPIDPPDECRFAKRCNYVCDQCHKSCPQLVEISEGHFVSCHLWENFK